MSFESSWLYSTGAFIVTIGAAFSLVAFQMRRTLVDVAARRLGLVIGAMAGAGVAVLALGLAADRLDEASTALRVAIAAAVVLLTIASAELGAHLVTAMAQRSDPMVSASTPAMQIEPGQRVVWSSSLASRWMLIPAIGLIVAGPLIMLAPDTPLWLLAVLIAAGFAVMSLASIRVRADADGLRVKYGVLPWPSTNIATERIGKASVIDVRPMEWGGWGYRGTLTLMKQAAVVLRAGPGIRLDLTDGRVFVVTIDDPETAVALLNAHT